MIAEEDRIARRDLYKRLDPDCRFQSRGYDYLVEEGDDLLLEAVTPERAYDLHSLPKDLLDACRGTFPSPAGGGVFPETEASDK